MRCHPRVGLLAVAAVVLLACDDQGPRTPADLVVVPNLPRVPEGGTTRLIVTVVDADGREIVGEPATFESSAPSILTVSRTGILTSVGPLGTSIVGVASGDLSTEVEARVVVGPSTLYVTPPSLELVRGEVKTLSVTVTDENGDSLPAPDVLFRTSNPVVAEVTAEGHVRGGEPGGATITITSGDQTRRVDVGVW
jgi:trimeric autotransporter adhesin